MSGGLGLAAMPCAQHRHALKCQATLLRPAHATLPPHPKESKMVEPAQRAPLPGGRPTRFGVLQAAIVLLLVATAAVHLYLAFVVMPATSGSIDPVFLLNGLGYLALLGALYLPLRFFARHRVLVRWLLVGYTALTVLLWLIITQFLGTEATPLGYVDKAIELVLIVLLVVDSQQQADSLT